jgi:multicomponent Na+:H+ antiporter subunit C
MILVLVLTIGVLYGAGAYLMLQRNLTRIVLGLASIGHGANLLLLVAGGRAGEAPLVGESGGPFADPLPQALALTAIVITFGVSAYLLALSYRSWLITRSDTVEDDVEDRRIADMAVRRRTEDRRPGSEGEGR